MVVMFSAACSEGSPPHQISKETTEDTTLSEKDTGTKKMAY